MVQPAPRLRGLGPCLPVLTTAADLAKNLSVFLDPLRHVRHHCFCDMSRQGILVRAALAFTGYKQMIQCGYSLKVTFERLPNWLFQRLKSTSVTW